ncbi:MAG: serine protease [Planctomycetaceae bacterium]|nr:serine protease [Planctomycetaceae bacterium]
MSSFPKGLTDVLVLRDWAKRMCLALAIGLSFVTAPVGLIAEEAPTVVRKPVINRIPRNLDDLRGMQTHVQKLAEQVIPATVAVQVGSAQGSGVIISADGYVLTVAHVSGRPGRVATLVLHDGTKVSGETLGIHRTLDAGLIKITATPRNDEWPHAVMGDSEKVQPGQWCLVTGHPGGFEEQRPPVLRLGRVLAFHEDSTINTDCTLIGGDSGGPLFNMNGKVIGVNSRIGNPLTVNLHVPVNVYRESWDRLARADTWGHEPGQRPYIGVQGKPEGKDATVWRVFPGTPAAQAGIKPGDLILRFGSRRVKDFEALQSLVRDERPGNRIKVLVRRGDDEVQLEVTVAKRPD